MIAAGLSIGLQVVGGIATVQTLQAVSNAFTSTAMSAKQLYSQNEQLALSLKSLAAGELIRKGAFQDMADAQSFATRKAKEMIEWNRRLAVESPFTSQQVAATMKMATAYGFSAASLDKYGTTAQRVTEAVLNQATAMGAGADVMQRVMLALGQMSATGRVTGEELNQLSEAGINARDSIARELGVSVPDLMRMIERGQVSGAAGISAIVSDMERNAGGAGKESASTIQGMEATLEDAKAFAMLDLATPAMQEYGKLLGAIGEAASDPAATGFIKELGVTFGQIAALTFDPAIGFLKALQDSAPAARTVQFALSLMADRMFGAGTVATTAWLMDAVPNAYDNRINAGRGRLLDQADPVALLQRDLEQARQQVAMSDQAARTARDPLLRTERDWGYGYPTTTMRRDAMRTATYAARQAAEARQAEQQLTQVLEDARAAPTLRSQYDTLVSEGVDVSDIDAKLSELSQALSAQEQLQDRLSQLKQIQTRPGSSPEMHAAWDRKTEHYIRAIDEYDTIAIALAKQIQSEVALKQAKQEGTIATENAAIAEANRVERLAAHRLQYKLQAD
ncbi:MAG: tape measure protein, partial [Chloroflexaceae bacterium]|nr:tape measure protein [Chloroflexaceae bacterium]